MYFPWTKKNCFVYLENDVKMLSIFTSWEWDFLYYDVNFLLQMSNKTTKWRKKIENPIKLTRNLSLENEREREWELESLR